MNARATTLLLELLRQPTVPFREHRVAEFAAEVLRRYEVPFFRDPIGNIVVGCGSRREYATLVAAAAREPLRLFVAHMDHPGFHGARWVAARRLQVQWHGGGPTRHLRGARVWIADASGLHHGTMGKARLAPGGRWIKTAEVHFDERTEAPRAPAASFYGGFAFRAPVWRIGRRLYTKAADDLVGVFAVLMTAIAQKRRAQRNFLGLLTRAEEVGFVGAVGHFELGWLARARRQIVCVSLETSRTLPHAVIGQGPVVRLGDRRTVFEPNALNVLAHVARRLLPGRHQRRVMDGGTCEATAATVYGLAAIGISIPLGNYHNQCLEGGPDCRGRDGPAPEFVHLDDIDGMLTLCRGLLAPRLPWQAPWQDERRVYKKRLNGYRRLL